MYSTYSEGEAVCFLLYCSCTSCDSESKSGNIPAHKIKMTFLGSSSVKVLFV